MRPIRIFISSVQKEFAGERRVIRDYVRRDALLHQFFDVFLFEDLPASDRRTDDVYLEEVGRCSIYMGILGNEYGSTDLTGLSPTEREFDHATACGKTRLIFVKGTEDGGRDPKMMALIHKAGGQLIRRRFTDVAELTTALYASLVEYLERQGMIQTRPYGERWCDDASLTDIDDRSVAVFVSRARSERQFALTQGTPIPDVLTHLHLLADGKVSNAAILLFGRNPQRFMPHAEIRCMHFHGTEIQRPAPFYRIFKGNLLEQIDQAVDFVLSKVNRSVETRAEGPQAPVRYELPEDVIAEAIVNAVAHRDYASAAVVQVSVFADRVEVWNPGELLPPLTPESLCKPHRSILRNPRVAEVLYLAHYIEKYGTGTLMMIRESVKHELPEPSFSGQQPGEFGVTIWRDWLTEQVMAALELNERQRKAVAVVKTKGVITNSVYQQAVSTSRPTAIRDLAELVAKGVFIRKGTARSVHYILGSKRLIHDSSDSHIKTPANDSKMTHTTQMTSGASPENASNVSSNIPSGTRLALSWHQVEMLDKCLIDTGITELLEIAGRTDRTKFRNQVLNPLIKAGFLEMTVPDKPSSSKQKYRVTEEGRDLLEKQTKEADADEK